MARSRVAQMPEFNRNRPQGQRAGGPPRGGRGPGGGGAPRQSSSRSGGEGADSPSAAAPWYVGTDFAHVPPGHRYLLYLPFWKQDWSAIKEGKQRELKSLCLIPAHARDAMSAIAERQRSIGKVSGGEVVEATSISPFATGLGWEHPNENGFAFLHPYGLPYLAGSGVKGVVRRAAEELALLESDSHGWDLATVWWLFGFEASSSVFDTDGVWRTAFARWRARSADGSSSALDGFIAVADVKFKGTGGKWVDRLQADRGYRQSLHTAGALRFLDVIPEVAGNSMSVDIMNPHYGDYYQAKKTTAYPNGATPHDASSPNPVFFLLVPPGSKFTFVVDCPREHHLPEALRNKWRDMIGAAFTHAFDWLGFGAKTAVGYGAMTDKPVVAQPEPSRAPAAARSDATTPVISEAIWRGARLKFNRANGTLTAEANGKQAHASAPNGEQLLATLPPDTQTKVRRNEFVKVNAVVQGSVLVRVEKP